MRTSYLVLPLMVLFAGALRAQETSTRFTIPIVVTNNVGTNDTLYLGLDERATAGIDADLGEEEYPPFPPTEIFEARFVNVGTVSALGEGVKKDLRPYREATQADTFRIRFQPGNSGFPVRFSWPAEIAMYGQKWSINVPTPVDMKSTTSATVEFDGLTVVQIIRENDAPSGVERDVEESLLFVKVRDRQIAPNEPVRVEYSTPGAAAAVIEIYNAMGERVAMADRPGTSGRREIAQIALRSPAAGVYYVKLHVNGRTSSTSFVVLR